MRERIESVRDGLRKKKLGGLLVTNPANLFYLTGVKIGAGFLVLGKDDGVILVPRLEYEEVKGKVGGDWRVICLGDRPLKDLGRVLAKARIRRIGFESNHTSAKRFREMRKELPSATLVPMEHLIEEMRIVKSEQEIALLRKSAEISIAAFRLLKRVMMIGMKEKTIATALEYFIRRKGGEDPSFETIVALGENTAFPHHRPGERELRARDPLLIDWGAVYKGYRSDLTRAFVLDIISIRNSRRVSFSDGFTGKLGEVFRIVKEAHHRAIERVKPGVKCSTIDREARKVIDSAGFGAFFIHRTGHGIGLDVHEAPWIEKNNSQVLKPGMVLTIEPGVYLPGLGGIRVEDMVLVTRGGFEILTEVGI